MTKIVVFGANGFIGQHLVKKLAESLENSIVAFDRFSNHQVGLDHPFHNYPNVEIVAGNFFNREEVSAVLTGIDYVFHLVSATNPATSNKDPFIDIDTNIRSSVELFQLCSEKGVKKVIFPSSGGTVYGDIDCETINEMSVPAPRSPYGIGKLTIESYLRYFKFSAGLDYIVYRIANPYGPGQNIHGKQGVIPIFMNKFARKEPLTIFGDGSMIRDYIYIDDLIEMMAGSFDKNNKFSTYNLGSGIGTSVNQIVKSIEKCTNHVPKKTYLNTPLTFVHKSVLDNHRFIKEFNIHPKTKLEEGVAKTWDYVKSIT